MIHVNANELRIGNKIWWLHEESEQPLTVDAEMIADIDHYNRFPDDDRYARGVWWAPIPLTPEILEKCGFRYAGRYAFGATGNRLYVLKNIELMHVKKGQPFLLAHYETQITSIHQLQNLYFALTNKELEIKF